MKIALLTTDNRDHLNQYQGDPWFGTAPSALLQGFAKQPDLEVHVLACTRRLMISPAKLAENIFFHSLHVPKLGWLRTAYLGCIRACRKKLKEIRPDIVHGQGTERECAISAVFSDYPNVLTIHGNMRLIAQVHRSSPLTYPWFAARLEQFTIPRSNGIVCITNYTREAVASLAAKTWVVPNAVDASFFDIKRVPATRRQILCVGHVDERKNQNALIRAVDALGSQRSFELIFLGGASPDSAYGREFLQLVEARSWCRYAGHTDRESLKQFLAAASGLILPSLEDNCPMVVLEAMAAGVPVAAAQVGGVPDLVRHGKTGWLFDPLSQEAMADAVNKLLKNHDSSMALEAQEEARKRFHPEIVARRHLEIYREVLS